MGSMPCTVNPSVGSFGAAVEPRCACAGPTTTLGAAAKACSFFELSTAFVSVANPRAPCPSRRPHAAACGREEIGGNGTLTHGALPSFPPAALALSVHSGDGRNKEEKEVVDVATRRHEAPRRGGTRLPVKWHAAVAPRAPRRNAP